MPKQPITADVLKGFFTKEQLQCIVGACMLETRALKKDVEKLIANDREYKQTIASLNTRITDLSGLVHKLRAESAQAGRAFE